MKTLEKETLKLIGEDVSSPDVFLDTATGLAQIRGSINDAIQQMCMVTGSYKKRYFLPLREDCQFYRISWEQDYFGYIVSAWDRIRHTKLEQTDVIRLTAEDAWWMQRNGYPEQYIHIGYQYLGIYMKPSSSDNVLELDCIVIPKAYSTDNDPIKMREAFQRATVQMAVSEFYASRGDASKATERLNEALETANLKNLHPDAAEQQYQFGGYRAYGRRQ
jgi:hypothetical protein